MGISAMIWAGLLLCAVPPATKVADLAWLSGAWLSETERGWTEEVWMAPRGGMLVGINRSGKADAASAFEYMRIEAAADGTIHLKASPGGNAPVAFRLVSLRLGEAVFENPAHDYPTRIVYRRIGDILLATVSGPGGANPLSWTFKRR